MTRLPLLTALLALAPAAVAGEYVLTVHGTVANAGPAPSSGPFTGVTSGDPVTLRLEVFVPGTVVSPGQYVSYTIDAAASTLEIGGAVGALAGGNVALQNDFPVADGIRMFGAPLAGGGSIAFECGEATGTMFSSADISMELGTLSASIFSSYNFLLTGNGGFVEIQPTDVTIGVPTIGSVFCTAGAVPNSTGLASSIFATGSDVLADDDVTLHVANAPANSFGYFITSPTDPTSCVLTGGPGQLCLCSPVGRYLNSIQSSGALGTYEHRIDVTAMPQPNGLVAAQVGETWSFQVWHRDSVMGTATSNFSDGVSVTFR
ncbi:MAG: hypothetical protein R3F49_10860 [Planctomycetota bacterium]